jgi:hypothetical protein
MPSTTPHPPEPGFLGSDTVTLHMVYPWGNEAMQELTLTWGNGATPPPEFRIFLPMVFRNGLVVRKSGRMTIQD